MPRASQPAADAELLPVTGEVNDSPATVTAGGRLYPIRP